MCVPKINYRERNVDETNDIYIEFVNIEKAFENVKWDKMFEVLNCVGAVSYTHLDVYKRQHTHTHTPHIYESILINKL